MVLMLTEVCGVALITGYVNAATRGGGRKAAPEPG